MKEVKETKIKEDRATRKEVPLTGLKDLFFKQKLEDVINSRVTTFWDDLYGIIDLLNKSNKKNWVNNLNSPIITNYFLWRILNELKILNVKVGTPINK